MKSNTRALTATGKWMALRTLPPALITLLALLTACSMPPQGRPSDASPMAPDPVQRQPRSYYEVQLMELPLRVKSYDLTGNQRRTPVTVREMHVIHDDIRDEILVIDADGGANHLWSIDAYDFTLHWKTQIEKRVNFDPLPTERYIHLMNSDGEYQGYDRVSSPRRGESRLVSMGRFEGDIFPSAPPASNDTHIFVPATNSNAMRGLGMINNASGDGGDTWTFPQVGKGLSESFMQIATQPAADSETIVFINNNHRLYMVDAQNGEFRANPHLGARSRTVPTIADGLVFVGSDIGQVFAFEKSGDAAWTVTVNGLPYGEIFVEDNWMFVRTLEIYDEVITDDRGERIVRAATRPGKLNAFRYEMVEVEGDRGVYSVIDGDPGTPHQVDPVWTEPDVGQEVLMVHDSRVYILYEDKEEFLSEREKAQLRAEGRVVSKEDELRTVSRRLRVLDLKTGNLERREWDLNLADFAVVRGSPVERDRAIYLATRDGYIFKAYGDGTGTGGGK